MERRSYLSFAVATAKASYVFMCDGQVFDWGITVEAVKSEAGIAGFAQVLITKLQPEVVVTETCDEHCRKGKRSRELIEAIADCASNNAVYDVAVPRPREFPTKYEEAVHLAARHPEVAGYLPDCKRRIYEFEPRGMMIFEAIALAKRAMKGPQKPAEEPSAQ
jgi:hypothetical protein